MTPYDVDGFASAADESWKERAKTDERYRDYVLANCWPPMTLRRMPWRKRLRLWVREAFDMESKS